MSNSISRKLKRLRTDNVAIRPLTRTMPLGLQVTVLAALSAGGTLATNILLPSLPGIAMAVGVSSAQVTSAITVFLAMFAVGQLIVGPVSTSVTCRVDHSRTPNSAFLLGGRMSASAECRHWSGRAVRWSSCAILLRPAWSGTPLARRSAGARPHGLPPCPRLNAKTYPG